MFLEKVVQATVASLGYLENGVYSPEPDCFAGLHDLVRYLHADKETLDARRICLVHNIVRNDLVPIMLALDTDEDLFNMALRLTVNLCQPTILVFNGKMPETDDIVQVYHDCETNLVGLLLAFTNSKIFEKFAVLVKNYFSKDWTDRKEADKTTIDRVIILIRYIFAIGMECPVSVEMPKVDSLTKERVIRAFLATELPTLLMAVGCDKMEKELGVHIMAIFSLLLRSIECERVATVQQTKSVQETEKEELELKEMIERERLVLTAKRSKFTTSRSHLGAIYVMKNAALNPDKDLIVQKSASNTPLDNLRPRKRTNRGTKRSRVRNVMESVFVPNKNAPLDICQLMNTFCKEFITRAFNKIMKTTREMALVNNKAGGVLAYSDVNYFFLAEYVFQFLRLAKMSIEKASSVFSREFFHGIISQCDTYFEMMKIDKLNITSYALRAQHAISAYKEMMLLLYSLAKSEQPTDKEAFSYLTRIIYWDEEYREFGYLTLNKLQAQGMTRKLLDDLIVACHYYILTMDHIVKAGELQIVAKRKRIAKQRKKKAKQLMKETEERSKTDRMDDDALGELWSELISEIRDVLDGKIAANDDISPINILLKVSDEQHQIFAALQIQRALRARRIIDAIGLFKGARDLWPEATFGDFANTVDQDIPILKDIYNMDLADIAADYDAQMKTTYGAAAEDPDTNIIEDDEHISVSDNEQSKKDEENAKSEDEEDKPKYKIAEINFDFNDYIRNFTKSDIIHWYIFSLKDFETNSTELNHAILKMFFRFGFQLNNPSLLYLASLFRIFARVNTEIQKWPKEAAKKHQFYDIYKLGYHVLQKFFGHFKERGELLICELLFNKNHKECMEIESGYGNNEDEQNEKEMLWTEELEAELDSLYNQYQALEEKPEGISIIDFIQHNLTKDRTPKQIKRQLKRLGLPVEKPKKPKKPKKEGTITKSRKKSKQVYDDDQLFASRTPSPTENSESSANETEKESDNESKSSDDEEENNEFSTKNQQSTIVGIEERLLREESTFLMTTKQHTRNDVMIEKEEEQITTIEEREFVVTQSSQSSLSNQAEEDENLTTTNKKPRQTKAKKSTNKRSPKKYREALRQPIEVVEKSDSDEPDENSAPDSQRTQQSLRRVLDSDESDTENLDLFDNNQHIDPTPNTSIKRFIDSDDEEEHPIVSQSKRQRILDSDDE